MLNSPGAGDESLSPSSSNALPAAGITLRRHLFRSEAGFELSHLSRQPRMSDTFPQRAALWTAEIVLKEDREAESVVVCATIASGSIA